MNTSLEQAVLDSEKLINQGVPRNEVVARFDSAIQPRKFPFPNAEARKAAYLSAERERQMFEANKQPFITPNFASDFWLSQGLTLVGGKSGQSKSTTAANVLAGFVEYRPDTTALVISGEEGTDAIINRTACVLLKKPYMEYHNRKLKRADAEAVRELALQLTERIIVADVSGWSMDTLEDVQAAITTCDGKNAHLVLFDYFQTLRKSKAHPEMDEYRVLKEFGAFLKEYGKHSAVPVVVFAQLYDQAQGPDFASRVQGDKHIYNHAFNVIEIRPDFDTGMTTFKIHKQRFGFSQGCEVVMKFSGGRYELEIMEDI